MRSPGILILALILPTTTAAADASTTMNAIEQILHADKRFASFLENAAENRLQVVLGLVEEDEDGQPQLVQHSFRADAEYFYPASTVKLLAAVAALEYLGDLRHETGLMIDAATPLTYHPLFDGEKLESADPSNVDGGRFTVEHEIRKIFLVSDNAAYNRLYELTGPALLNRSMHRAGLDSARIVHRLSEARTAAENRRTPRIDLVGTAFRHQISERVDELDLTPIPVGGLDIGRGYLRGGERIDAPMDFREKNRISLVDLQRALCKVVRPEVDAGGEGFRLTDSQRSILLEAMRQLPRESRNPVYDSEEFPDDWVKFLLPGLRRVVPDEHLRIYDKSGQAYGFTLDNAYVTDVRSGRSFFLAAVIYTNRDGILNDDKYEYDEISLPFFADLGEAVARALWSPP